MASPINFTRNYTNILDEVYKRAACSMRRMARAGRNAKEIMILKIKVTGLGNYTRNVGYKTDSTTYELETETFNYDRSIKLLADVMDIAGQACSTASLPPAPSSSVRRWRRRRTPSRSPGSRDVAAWSSWKIRAYGCIPFSELNTISPHTILPRMKWECTLRLPNADDIRVASRWALSSSKSSVPKRSQDVHRSSTAWRRRVRARLTSL